VENLGTLDLTSAGVLSDLRSSRANSWYALRGGFMPAAAQPEMLEVLAIWRYER
jgi:hypothetical protein